MKRPVLVFFFVASWLFVAWSGTTTGIAADPVELTQNPSHICYSDCIDKYGTDSKAACARQCGLIGATKDCSKIYKTCIKGCGKDKNCKKQCRTANQSCV